MTLRSRGKPFSMLLLFGGLAASGLAGLVAQSPAPAEPFKIGMRTDHDGQSGRPADPVGPADGLPGAGAAAKAASPAIGNGRGNPLWAIPLSSLSATRERPIFSASRRGPPVILSAPSLPQPAPTVARPARPLLSLVGAIASDSDGMAIFLDDATKGVIRLKIGEEYSGWMLTVVQGREATMQRDADTVTLELPGPPAK